MNEVVGHLIEAERRGFAGRIREMLEADDPVFVTWDQPSVAAARHDCQRAPEELIGEFVGLRVEVPGSWPASPTPISNERGSIRTLAGCA